MSEMALTADHLIVIGKGELIAEVGVQELVRGASSNAVRVRSPHASLEDAFMELTGESIEYRAGDGDPVGAATRGVAA
jgi:ABC-type multidrug transport system ATPase subunit